MSEPSGKATIVENKSNSSESKPNPNDSKPSPKVRPKWVRRCVFSVLTFFLVGPILLYALGLYRRQMLNAGYVRICSEMVGIAIVTLLVVAYFYRGVAKDAAATEEEKDAQVLIFLILVTSFYAFGWPEDFYNLRRSFSELSVIAVLFFLSELAAHQLRQARIISARTENAGHTVANQLNESSKEATIAISGMSQALLGTLSNLASEMSSGVRDIGSAARDITDSDLHTTVGQLVALNKMGSAVSKVEDAAVRDMLIQQISMYAAGWAKHLQAAETNPALLACVQEICGLYVNAEVESITGNTGRGARHAHICLTTTTPKYFELLTRIVRPAGLPSGIRLEYRAITNYRPSDWFNYRLLADGTRIADDHVDAYRKSITELISQGAVCERAILVSESRDVSVGDGLIASGNELLRQAELDILFLSKRSGQAPEEAAQQIVDWERLFSSRAVELKLEGLGNAPDKTQSMYAIVTTASATKLVAELNIAREIEVKETVNKWVIERRGLIEYYTKILHSGGGAKIIQVDSSGAVFRKPFLTNPDVLIVGSKNKEGKFVPIISVSARLVVGSEAVEVSIVMNRKELDDVMQYWESNITDLSEYLRNSNLSNTTMAGQS